MIESATSADVFPGADHELLRRHELAVRARGHGRAARLSVRRRGGPGVARRRARARHLRPHARPARRPRPAPAGAPGHPPRERRPLGARAPARRGAQHGRARDWASSSSTRGGCTPTSAATSPHAFYEDRLDSAPGCERQIHARSGRACASCPSSTRATRPSRRRKRPRSAPRSSASSARRGRTPRAASARSASAT